MGRIHKDTQQRVSVKKCMVDPNYIRPGCGRDGYDFSKDLGVIIRNLSGYFINFHGICPFTVSLHVHWTCPIL